MWWSRFVVVGALAVAVAAVGCDRSPSGGGDEKPRRHGERTDTDDDGGAGSETSPEPDTSFEPITAFGLPLPPEFIRMFREEGEVQVETEMSLETLRRFYRREIDEYEVREFDPETHLIAGPPEHSHEIAVYDRGGYRQIDYRPRSESKPKPDARTTPKGKESPRRRLPTGANTDESAPPVSPSMPKKGRPKGH